MELDELRRTGWTKNEVDELNCRKEIEVTSVNPGVEKRYDGRRNAMR